MVGATAAENSWAPTSTRMLPSWNTRISAHGPNDRQPVPVTGRRKGKELIYRLRGGRCEWCNRRAEVQVHHVRAHADLVTPGRPQPEWSQLMSRMRRKALVVCPPCHDEIHNRHPPRHHGDSHWRAG